MDDPARTTPAPLRLAAAVVGLQGVGLLALAAVGLLDVAPDRLSAGVSVSVFFALYGAALLACAVALLRRQGWARGPVILTQLIQLGLAFNLRDSLEVAVPLGLTAAVAVAAMVQPATTAALAGDPYDERD